MSFLYLKIKSENGSTILIIYSFYPLIDLLFGEDPFIDLTPSKATSFLPPLAKVIS